MAQFCRRYTSNTTVSSIRQRNPISSLKDVEWNLKLESIKYDEESGAIETLWAAAPHKAQNEKVIRNAYRKVCDNNER